jgi:hypothetical protein
VSVKLIPEIYNQYCSRSWLTVDGRWAAASHRQSCLQTPLFFPPWWDNNRTITQTPTPGLDAEGLTPNLLRLKLYHIWTWEILFIYFYDFFYPPCLSNVCLAHCLLVHYLSLFISSALVFVMFYFFPFSLPSLLSLFSHPSILDITIITIIS